MTLILNDRFTGITEPEVKTYIDAVEQADQQLIEFEVANAINDFVRGCKNDAIWDAIKSCCILAGARTLTGALRPLKGVAPTSFNFVSDDYNRKTGLVGNGSTKYLNSNYGIPNSIRNNCHMSGYATSLSGGTWVGAQDASRTRGSFLSHTGSRLYNSLSTFSPSDTTSLGFRGISRSSSVNYLYRRNGSNETHNRDSINEFLSFSNGVFAQRISLSPVVFESITASRLAFYSIGESLNPALLDTRVTTLMNTFTSVIPS